MELDAGISRNRARAVGTIAALVGSSLAFVPGAQAATGSTTLLSSGMGGSLVNAEAKEPSISADGRYVAYASAASNIVGDDSNGLSDIFVRDRATGETILVSRGTDGAIGNGDSMQPSISPDGRYVAFVSNATNFQPETNPTVNGTVVNARDIFLRDLKDRTTVRVTRGGGNPGSVGASFDPSVSTNAAFVAFTSLDRQITGTGDCNDVHDVVVWERATGVVSMVSVGTTKSVCGTAPNTFEGILEGNRESQNPSISADGRLIAYSSDSFNLDEDTSHQDSNHYEIPAPPLTTNPRLGTNVFLWDRTTNKSTRIDNGPSGAEPDGDAGFVPAISADGKLIAYMSSATNLVSGDTNGQRDTFLYTVATKDTTRVSVAANGTEQKCLGAAQTGCQSYEAPALSSDGRYVAFISGANNLVQPDTNVRGRDVYVRDNTNGALTRVNVADNGSQANDDALGSPPSVSYDGRFVAYPSHATNLVTNDTNNVPDVFVADRSPADAKPASWGGPAIWGGGGGGGGGGGTTGPGGYWLVASDGGIFAFGDAAFFGSTGNIKLNRPIVGMTTTPSGNGYWLVASDGGIFAFGDAAFFGSTGNLSLAKPIVGMTSTPSGKGYWMVASDGGIFAFGDAKFQGSTGNLKLAKPIRGMATTPSGSGYWLVASDGGIFAFGDAKFQGSTGNLKLAKPIEAMTATKTGNGYWMTASDGGIFAFGDATFYGSAGNLKLAKPIVTMASTRSGGGYWLVATDGGIFSYGDAAFKGSTGAIKLNQPIVGMTGK